MFSSTYKKRKAGFTLIEMVIYIALLVVISTAAVTALVSLTETVVSYRASQLVMRNAAPLMERFQTDVRNAHAVDLLNSTLESTPGTLEVMQGATTTAYTLSGGVVEVTQGGSTVALTGSGVSVSELRFFAYDNLTTEMVRMQVTLSATVGSVTHTKTFNTATVLRGSYE